jgi:sialidase-1
MPSRARLSSAEQRRAFSLGRWAAVVATVAAVAAGLILVPTSGEAAICTSVPFRRYDSGYSYFRIPALVKTTKGMLLAFAEARFGGGGDSGDIDIVLRRSVDGGCTWGRLIVVADHANNTIGNPAPVYDSVTKRVILLATGNGGSMIGDMVMTGKATPSSTRRAYQLTSSNDGLTWSEKEITRSVKAPGWRWYATGPGHGVQIHGGKYNGRLVVTGVHSGAPLGLDVGAEHKYSGAHAIISDDHGKTWRVGFVDTTYDGKINTNETGVAQLADGRLYFNSRDQLGQEPGTRAFAYSDTGAMSLTANFTAAPAIVAPMVECSVLGLGNRLLFAGPAATDGSRRRMTIRSATDNGESGAFSSEYVLWPGYAAYSDLVAMSATSVGVLYERGKASPYDEIAFQVVSVGQLRPVQP